ncbi:leucine-rich repeat-containing protein 71-like isoform X2 [Sycon ciliatum]|uniref:leucine-rich repeat-containing protein 71-like isoform X2 n=1 Tax=Sycon ciliatum TaxID=27933 RepID=UPI0031F6ECF3
MAKGRDKQSRLEAQAELAEVVVDPATYVPTGNIEQDLPILCQREGVRSVTCTLAQPEPGAARPQATPEASPAAPPPTTASRGSKAAREKQAAAEAAAAAALQAQAEEEPPDPNAPKTYKEVDMSKMIQRVCQVRYASEEDRTTLDELRISKWRLEPAYVTVFTSMIPLWKQLTRLELVNNQLCSSSILNIITSLKSVATPNPLRYLSLDGNPVCDDRILSSVLTEPFSLHSLSLRACAIDDDMCLKLEALLLANTCLHILDLSLNRIYDTGAQAIARMLRFNRTLLMLALIGNNITDVGAGSIADALQMFELTHEEIVKRRYLLADRRKRNEPPAPSPAKGKGTLEHKSKSPTLGGRESRQSVLAGKQGKKGQDGGKTAVAKKKEEEKGKKGDQSRLQKTRMKSSMSESGVSLSGKEGRKIVSASVLQSGEDGEPYNALLDDVAAQDGKQWCMGNLTLVSLDLTENAAMTMEIVDRFFAVLQYQKVACQERTAPRQGLMNLQCWPKYICPNLSSDEADEAHESRPPSTDFEVARLKMQRMLIDINPVERKKRLKEEREREAANALSADSATAT